MSAKAGSYFATAYPCHCIVCNRSTQHTPLLSAFHESEKGHELRKLGQCKDCGQINEKVIPAGEEKKEPKVKAPKEGRPENSLVV